MKINNIIEDKKNKLKSNFAVGVDDIINEWQKMSRRELKRTLVNLKETINLEEDQVNRAFFEIGNIIYKHKFNKEVPLR